jgi:dTDP-4-amino-4,6-dideoxy-D-galactose acyltransferase
MGKNYEFSALQWDTEYFGIKSARVNLTGIADENEQDEIIKLSAEYDFVTISNHGNINENNQWIGLRTQAFLADMNIQFQKSLSNHLDLQTKKLDPQSDCLDIKEMIIVTNLYPPNEDVLQIANEAFRYSRFFNDPRLPQDKAKRIYRQWTKCAFCKEEKYFVVCEKEGHVAGYILFSRNDKSYSIELIAVDKDYQGQKIGKSLLQGMETFLRAQGSQQNNGWYAGKQHIGSTVLYQQRL